VSNGGTVESSVALHDRQTLVGLALHRQLVLLEFDQSFVFVDNSSSNALASMIGSCGGGAAAAPLSFGLLAVRAVAVPDRRG
jgi:hypothetical protein